MKDQEIAMGRLGDEYKGGIYQNVTICVTEDCNLRCKYCYMVHKNNFNKLTFDTAKKIVDFVLDQPPAFNAVVWDFIGGEPTLEIELIDRICSYIIEQLDARNHIWKQDYMFSMSTNGILYRSPRVQEFIKKYYMHLSIGITIDGIKEKHDLQRVDKNGRGSYDTVLQSVQLWKKQFPNSSTKVTFASADLKYLADSIIHLWNLGIKRIPANVVYEDVWNDGDEIIFEEQLVKLADYIIDNKLWSEYSVRFFDYTVGMPLSEAASRHNFCGSGKMLAFDCNGKIYPCIRFLDFCMPDDSTNICCIGDVDTGIDSDRRHAFDFLSVDLLNDEECRNCPVARGCFSCAGNNYGEYGTIFIRTKHHCKMHKAQARANKYFWDRMNKILSEPTPYELERVRIYKSASWNIPSTPYLLFLLSTNSAPHCMYVNTFETEEKMPQHVFDKGIQYAELHDMVPVFIGNPTEYLDKAQQKKLHITICDDIDYMNSRDENEVAVSEFIPIITDVIQQDFTAKSVILLVNSENLNRLTAIMMSLIGKCDRINVVKSGFFMWSEPQRELYLTQLEEAYKEIENKISVNVFHSNSPVGSEFCDAGNGDVTLAPNGEVFICPAFFYNKEKSIGDIEHGYQVANSKLISVEKYPQCHTCSAGQCLHCNYLNYKSTGFANVASESLCQFIKREAEVSGK